MRLTIFSISLTMILVSCLKESDPVIPEPTNSFLSGKGVFLVNEGNFRSGNGSLSYFSYDSSKMFNNIFLEINKRPLGDIPYSINMQGSRAYIIVNNSGKVEVVDRNDMKSVASISGVISPRYISFINDSKAYVSSLYSDSLTIVNLLTNTIAGYINIKKSSESMVSLFSISYVANWAGGNKIMVINNDKDKVVDSISVGSEPESMVIDKNGILWVLCNGGWRRDYFAELISIDTRTNKIEKRFTFPLKTDSPTCLQINKQGETLFYLQNGIRRMNIDATELPKESFISANSHTFYKLGINPDNNEIFVTDIVDFMQKGYLLRYSSTGIFISSMQVDIIPGGMYFKVNPDPNTQ